MISRTMRSAAAIILAVTAMAACSDPYSTDDDDDGGNDPVVVTIVPSNPTVAAGAQITLQATLANDTTAGPNRGVTWSSANTAVLTIDAATGVATGVAAGTSKVIATSKHRPSAKDSVTVTVTAVIPTVATIPLLGRGLVPERYTAEVAAANGYAYTTTWGGRTFNGTFNRGNVVKVWNVAGNVPVLVDTLKIPDVGTTSDVQITPDGSMMVVSTEGLGTGSIVMYSLADPAHPAFIARFQNSNTLRGVHTVKLSEINGTLYGFLQIDPTAALMIVDMSNPLAVQQVFYQVMGAPYVHDVFVRDGFLFTALWNDGMSIFDVGGGTSGGSPSNPVFLGNVDTPTGQIHNIWWVHDPEGGKKYALLGEEGPGGVPVASSGDIHVIDVSNMAAPVEVATYSVAGAGTHNFYVDEESMVLYAAYYNAGVRAIDVSGNMNTCDAAQRVVSGPYAGKCDLRLMGRELAVGMTTGSYVWGVTMQGDRLYASDMNAGIAVLDISALKR